jgi:hypothetical protein
MHVRPLRADARRRKNPLEVLFTPSPNQSMIRTIELILGLSPLSQYDDDARPMFNCFTDKPDLTPYKHEKAWVNLDEKNTRKDYGAQRSEKMDWSDYDRIDDFELNEILWRSIKGRNAQLPAPVRRAIAYRPADPVRK